MERDLYTKKGQNFGAVGAIITLIIGVGVSVLVLIFVGALGGQTYNLVEDEILEIGNNSVINESFTALNNTAVTLAHGDIHTAGFSIINNTNGVVMGLGNFSIDYTAGTVTLLSEIGNNNSVMNASYNWGQLSAQESVKNSIVSGFEALEQTGNYLPIIVLAVVISLVLALVLGFTSLGGASKGTAL